MAPRFANDYPAMAAAPYQMQPLGYQQLTPTSATGLAPPANATFALIKADTAAATWRDDGIAPTASVGMPMATSDPPLLYAGDLTAIQFISATGHVNISYYR